VYRILAEDGTAGHLEIETAREGIAGDEEELLLQADVGLQTLDVVAQQLEQTRALLAHGLPMRTKFSFIRAMFFCSASRCVQNTATHHRRGPAGSAQSSMELLMHVAWHPSVQFGLFFRQPNWRPHFRHVCRMPEHRANTAKNSFFCELSTITGWLIPDGVRPMSRFLWFLREWEERKTCAEHESPSTCHAPWIAAGCGWRSAAEGL